MTKEELQAKADKEYFAKYPFEKELLATEDGMFFTVYNRPYALQHERESGHKLHVLTKAKPASQEGQNEPSEAEMEVLKARYEQLFGKKPAHNMKPETMVERIEEKMKEGGSADESEEDQTQTEE